MQIETQLIASLTSAGLKLAVAESCTGGLLAARLTAVPGASAVFVGGVVAYANSVKRDLLGVPAEMLETAGAVSAETALAMARGVRRIMQADVSAAITGIAGPGGALPDKPVGLVFVAVSGPQGETVQRMVFAGNREIVRDQACVTALSLLRRLV
jgi:PncC family amidohydrolase